MKSPPYRISRTGITQNEPVSLDQAKKYLRITDNNDDELISLMISAARISLEEYLRVCIASQMVKISFDGLPPQPIDLPFGVMAVSSVSISRSNSSNITTLQEADYKLDKLSKFHLLSSTIGDYLHISYNSGFGSNVAEIPAILKHAILVYIGSIYENRSAEIQIPAEIMNMVNPYRMVKL